LVDETDGHAEPSFQAFRALALTCDAMEAPSMERNPR
jgi:hypothetical protein